MENKLPLIEVKFLTIEELTMKELAMFIKYHMWKLRQAE